MHRYGMNVLQQQPSDYILNIPRVRFIESAFFVSGRMSYDMWRA
jgi:hypothetical protein